MVQNLIDQDIQTILEFYPLSIQEARCLNPMNEGNKWFLQTNIGPKILQKMAVKPERMLFIAQAYSHLLHNGFPITPIQLTNNNGLCISKQNHTYILYDKYSGSDYSYYNEEHLLQVIKALGDFHIASKNYFPPNKSKKRSRLGKYHKLFQWKIQELEGYKMLSQAHLDDPFSKLFHEHVDIMIQRANQSLKELDEKPYQLWVEHFRLEGGFCQQDFKLSAFTNIDGKPLMKELPSITIDLPTRDLRILLNKVMLKIGVWDSQLATKMLQSYEMANPLTEEQYKVLWTDLRFPYLFCFLAHEYYLNQNPSRKSEKYLMELKIIIDMELSKKEFLHEFTHYVSQIKKLGGNNDGEQ